MSGIIKELKGNQKSSYQCVECGTKEADHRVYSFGDDEDGYPCWMCESCFNEHELKGDWCS